MHCRLDSNAKTKILPENKIQSSPRIYALKLYSVYNNKVSFTFNFISKSTLGYHDMCQSALDNS